MCRCWVNIERIGFREFFFRVIWYWEYIEILVETNSNYSLLVLFGFIVGLGSKLSSIYDYYFYRVKIKIYYFVEKLFIDFLVLVSYGLVILNGLEKIVW